MRDVSSRRSISRWFSVPVLFILTSLHLFSTPLFFYISVRQDVDNKNEIIFCFEKKRKINTLIVERHIPGTANDWVKVWEMNGPTRTSCISYGQPMVNTLVQATRLEPNIRYRVIVTAKTTAFWGPPEDRGWTEFKLTQTGELVVAGPREALKGWEDL